MVYTLRFISSKCCLFHNSKVFGSCIIHILYTVCAKIKKIITAPKVKQDSSMIKYLSKKLGHTAIDMFVARWRTYLCPRGQSRSVIQAPKTTSSLPTAH